MIEFHCVPEDDAQFANCVRAVATYLSLAKSRLGARRGAWEAPLHGAFGYLEAEARVHTPIGGPVSVTVYRERASTPASHRRRLGPVE